MELTKQQRKRVADYLATIHATGWLPSGLHAGSGWSSTVLMGYTFSMETRRFELKPESLALIEGHPMLATVEALKAQGYRINTHRIADYRRWTITKGIPMNHSDDFRTLFVSLDGSAHLCDGPDGRWVGQPLGNPGQEVQHVQEY